MNPAKNGQWPPKTVRQRAVLARSITDVSTYSRNATDGDIVNNSDLTSTFRRSRIALGCLALVALLSGCGILFGESGFRFEKNHEIKVDGVIYDIYLYTPREAPLFIEAFGVKPQSNGKSKNYVLINGRYVPCEGDCRKEVRAILKANKQAKATLFPTKPGQFKPTNSSGPIEPPGGDGEGGGGGGGSGY